MTDDLLWHIQTHVISTAYSLLPGKMASPEATAMLLAIGLQESAFQHRRQVGGPARGFWQFEKEGGVAGVLSHPLTHPIIVPVCDLLIYPATTLACHVAIEHNDVLAACFARLLLWTDPRTLPARTDASRGWQVYISQWRPGKPHRETWTAHFAHAWQVVGG